MSCLICSRILENNFPSLPCLEILFYIYGEGLILPLYLNYNGVCIDMIVNIITVFVLICLCISQRCLYYYVCVCYKIIVGCTSSWYFDLYLPCAWVIPPLHHFYIFFVIICLLILYLWFLIYIYMLHKIYSLVVLHIGNYVNAYFLYIICCSIVAILFYLHSQRWINILLFELLVTRIEANIFVPSFSISHTFISIEFFPVVSYS